MPFWEWQASEQLYLFHRLPPSDFIANERWLGQELIAPGTRIRAAGPLKYVTVIRDPLDRIVSHFLFRQMEKGLNETLDYFAVAGPCPSIDAGFSCWDRNYYVQVFAGLKACGGQPTGPNDSGNTRSPYTPT